MMSALNGEQLFGLRRASALYRMGSQPELWNLSLRQRLALLRVASESKLTLLDDLIYANTFTPPFPSLAYDRFMQGLVSASQGTPVPLVVNFAVTSQCVCKCWHCSLANRQAAPALSYKELHQCIDTMQQLGASVIGLTGGEPLLRADLEQVVACIGERSTPLLFTTGYELTTERARALKRAGLKVPVVSLDHYRAEVHDAGRGVRGMFDHAVKAIRLFQEQGLYTAVSFVPTRTLLKDRRELMRCIDFFRTLGVNDLRITSPILSGKLTAQPQAKLRPKHVRMLWRVQKLCTQSKGYPAAFTYDYFEHKRIYGCTAGYSYLFIDAQGNVCPCDFTMMSFGNVHQQPLHEIWADIAQRFRAPGPSCYASEIAGQVQAENASQWPLPPEASRRIHSACPSYQAGKLPRFFRNMGLRL